MIVMITFVSLVPRPSPHKRLKQARKKWVFLATGVGEGLAKLLSHFVNVLFINKSVLRFMFMFMWAMTVNVQVVQGRRSRSGFSGFGQTKTQAEL